MRASAAPERKTSGASALAAQLDQKWKASTRVGRPEIAPAAACVAKLVMGRVAAGCRP